jgi:hypothetical protein
VEDCPEEFCEAVVFEKVWVFQESQEEGAFLYHELAKLIEFLAVDFELKGSFGDDIANFCEVCVVPVVVDIEVFGELVGIFIEIGEETE